MSEVFEGWQKSLARFDKNDLTGSYSVEKLKTMVDEFNGLTGDIS